MVDDPKSELSAAQQAAQRFWLEFLGQNIEIRPGALMVGRSSSCQIVLDDGLVSRRHARFVATRDTLMLEDLESVNGVYVNSKRVDKTQSLKNGDRVLIGKSEFLVRSMQFERPAVDRRSAETLHGIEIPPTLAFRMSQTQDVKEPSAAPAPVRAANPPTGLANGAPPADEQTREGDVFELLGTVAEKVLAMGRGDEAERILSTALGNLMNDARSPGGANLRTAERALGYALKLAEATGRARWVDYCFDLYGEMRRPLPAETVDQLHTLVRKVNNVSVTTLRAYIATLQGVAATFGPSERFVLQRLEGLERVLVR